MIEIKLNDKEIEISFKTDSYPTFNKIVRVLKNHKFIFNSSSKKWRGPLYKHDEIVEDLENLDEIKDEINKEDIENPLSSKPEMEMEKTRRIPDYSIMNCSPMKGKSPYENFQNEGISKGINRSRYAYFWEMGTGKSYVLAAIIAHRLYKYHDASKALILTTSIGVRNLKYELKKFIKDLDETRIVIGDKNNRKPFNKDADIVIANYNSFRLICEAYKKDLKVKTKNPRKPFLPLKEWFDGGEGILALDESHEVSNPSSQRGYLVALHSELFKYRYLFSGTPADKPEKLFNQFKILDPYLIYNLSFNDWKEKMAYIGTYFSKYEVREWKKEELEKSNKRFVERHGNYYKTTDLVDLPEYYEKKIYIDMHPYHRDLYQKFIISDLQRQMKTDDFSVKAIINRFPYMMLAIDNPFLLKKHEERFDDDLNILINNFKESYLEKFRAVDDIIESYPNDKILIWAIHPLTINMLGERYKKYNPICITGNTDQDSRNELVEKFKKGDHQLLIANIATLNTSVTITDCRVQVYVERGFTFATFEQSTRRIYRIGQDKPVTTYFLIYDNSLDNAVDENLSSKGKLVSGLVSKNFLSQEEWSTIFNSKSTDTRGRFFNYE